MTGFFRKYKWYMIGSVLALIIAVVILIVLSAGPQRGPFIYQIH